MEKDATGYPSLPTHTGLRTPAQAVPRQQPTLIWLDVSSLRWRLLRDLVFLAFLGPGSGLGVCPSIQGENP